MIQSFIHQIFAESNMEKGTTRDAIINVVRSSDATYNGKILVDLINNDSILITEVSQNIGSQITCMCNESHEIQRRIMILCEIIDNLRTLNEAILIEGLKFKTLLALFNKSGENIGNSRLKTTFMELENIKEEYENVLKESNELSTLAKKFSEINTSKSLISEDFYSLELSK